MCERVWQSVQERAFEWELLRSLVSLSIIAPNNFSSSHALSYFKTLSDLESAPASRRRPGGRSGSAGRAERRHLKVVDLGLDYARLGSQRRRRRRRRRSAQNLAIVMRRRRHRPDFFGFGFATSNPLLQKIFLIQKPEKREKLFFSKTSF